MSGSDAAQSQQLEYTDTSLFRRDGLVYLAIVNPGADSVALVPLESEAALVRSRTRSLYTISEYLLPQVAEPGYKERLVAGVVVLRATRAAPIRPTDTKLCREVCAVASRGLPAAFLPSEDALYLRLEFVTSGFELDFERLGRQLDDLSPDVRLQTGIGHRSWDVLLRVFVSDPPRAFPMKLSFSTVSAKMSLMAHDISRDAYAQDVASEVMPYFMDEAAKEGTLANALARVFEPMPVGSPIPGQAAVDRIAAAKSGADLEQRALELLRTAGYNDLEGRVTTDWSGMGSPDAAKTGFRGTSRAVRQLAFAMAQRAGGDADIDALDKALLGDRGLLREQYKNLQESKAFGVRDVGSPNTINDLSPWLFVALLEQLLSEFQGKDHRLYGTGKGRVLLAAAAAAFASFTIPPDGTMQFASVPWAESVAKRIARDLPIDGDLTRVQHYITGSSLRDLKLDVLTDRIVNALDRSNMAEFTRSNPNTQPPPLVGADLSTAARRAALARPIPRAPKLALLREARNKARRTEDKPGSKEATDRTKIRDLEGRGTISEKERKRYWNKHGEAGSYIEDEEDVRDNRGQRTAKKAGGKKEEPTRAPNGVDKLSGKEHLSKEQEKKYKKEKKEILKKYAELEAEAEEMPAGRRRDRATEHIRDNIEKIKDYPLEKVAKKLDRLKKRIVRAEAYIRASDGDAAQEDVPSKEDLFRKIRSLTKEDGEEGAKVIREIGYIMKRDPKIGDRAFASAVAELLEENFDTLQIPPSFVGISEPENAQAATQHKGANRDRLVFYPPGTRTAPGSGALVLRERELYNRLARRIGDRNGLTIDRADDRSGIRVRGLAGGRGESPDALARTILDRVNSAGSASGATNVVVRRGEIPPDLFAELEDFQGEFGSGVVIERKSASALSVRIPADMDAPRAKLADRVEQLLLQMRNDPRATEGRNKFAVRRGAEDMDKDKDDFEEKRPRTDPTLQGSVPPEDIVSSDEEESGVASSSGAPFPVEESAEQVGAGESSSAAPPAPRSLGPPPKLDGRTLMLVAYNLDETKDIQQAGYIIFGLNGEQFQRLRDGIPEALGLNLVDGDAQSMGIYVTTDSKIRNILTLENEHIATLQRKEGEAVALRMDDYVDMLLSSNPPQYTLMPKRKVALRIPSNLQGGRSTRSFRRSGMQTAEQTPQTPLDQEDAGDVLLSPGAREWSRALSSLPLDAVGSGEGSSSSGPPVERRVSRRDGLYGEPRVSSTRLVFEDSDEEDREYEQVFVPYKRGRGERHPAVLSLKPTPPESYVTTTGLSVAIGERGVEEIKRFLQDYDYEMEIQPDGGIDIEIPDEVASRIHGWTNTIDMFANVDPVGDIAKLKKILKSGTPNQLDLVEKDINEEPIRMRQKPLVKIVVKLSKESKEFVRNPLIMQLSHEHGDLLEGCARWDWVSKFPSKHSMQIALPEEATEDIQTLVLKANAQEMYVEDVLNDLCQILRMHSGMNGPTPTEMKRAKSGIDKDPEEPPTKVRGADSGEGSRPERRAEASSSGGADGNLSLEVSIHYAGTKKISDANQQSYLNILLHAKNVEEFKEFTNNIHSISEVRGGLEDEEGNSYPLRVVTVTGLDKIKEYLEREQARILNPGEEFDAFLALNALATVANST